jgi:hypothetical protein
MPTHDERLVENQQESRSANERLQSAIDGQMPSAGTIPFLCECADLTCGGRIEITTGDYDATHIFRDRYIILPGHKMTATETVLETDPDGYVVAQKG